MRQKRWLCLLLLPLLALLGARETAMPALAPQPAGYIALTFDDSPNGSVTERLLDGLRERGAHATFFIIGQQIEGQEALLRRMEAEGHQIGNHTFTHRRIDTTGAVGLHELERTEELLCATLGGSGYWVRPPWGFASAETLRETNVPLIHWSLDTEDWSVLDADRVAACVLNGVCDGDIVLLHDSYETSVDAALRVVDELSAHGYVFVTVEELFERMGVTPETGRLYSRPDALRPVK
ncbi:MAG: polysaccharide deacetylase family protein [Oscillospiraceae bacterium]|nr:polysaccharide deacetylase family protein [Oscillospiraceae bacterium]